MPLHTEDCQCGYPDCHLQGDEPAAADLAEFGRYLDASELRSDLEVIARILAPLLQGDGIALACVNLESACMGGACQRCQLEKIVATYQRREGKP